VRTILLDYDGEPAKLVEDDRGIIHEAKVFRDGKWEDHNVADLYCKSKIATPEVFEAMLERRGGK
jgi:hypothetical protein